LRSWVQSIAFYERHFGFKNYAQQTVTGGPRIAYLKLGDTVLEMGRTHDWHPSGSQLRDSHIEAVGLKTEGPGWCRPAVRFESALLVWASRKRLRI
jgi:hypothetical protein